MKLALVLAFLAIPAVVQAQVVGGGSDPNTIVNSIVTYFTGPLGVSLSILAIMGGGALAIAGRFAAMALARIVLGIVIIFSAGFLMHTVLGLG